MPSITQVKELPSTSLSTSQVSVTTSATLLVAANPNRSFIVVTNLGTTDVYLGITGVTTATGALLLGAKGTDKAILCNAAVYGIVAAGSQTVSIEEYF